MNLKRTIAAGLSAAVLVSSGLTVSAAEKAPVSIKAPVSVKSLIVDVEAYKAAYPDLAQAFGDDTDAYVTHYLTIGVYEGRTKGVLFDPLTYTEAYSDIKDAFGYDIPAIVNHYVTCGIAENRTMGTSHGYADIATAESAGMRQYYLPRQNSASYTDTTNNSNSGSSYTADNSNSGSSGSNYTAGSSSSSDSATAYNNAAAAAIGSAADRWQAHHTTSILHDDGSLWRVEYYDENNNLKQYSSVTYTDTSTNSYTENVYSYDTENNVEILERTDTYVNGVLDSSTPGN